MIRRFGVTLLATFLPLAALCQATLSSPPADPALLAVAKAWSLPSEPIQGTAEGAQVSPGDLAAAALLWKSGGPPPEEGWRLRTSEKSWEVAAQKAGVPVDALLKAYRGLLSDQTRQALAGTGEDWLVLAEIRTLERLTGRGARTVATQLAASDFQTLLLAALPEAGPPVSRQPPPASSAPSAPNRWQPADPMAPIPLEGAPKNTGHIGTEGPPNSR